MKNRLGIFHSKDTQHETFEGLAMAQDEILEIFVPSPLNT